MYIVRTYYIGYKTNYSSCYIFYSTLLFTRHWVLLQKLNGSKTKAGGHWTLQTVVRS